MRFCEERLLTHVSRPIAEGLTTPLSNRDRKQGTGAGGKGRKSIVVDAIAADNRSNIFSRRIVSACCSGQNVRHSQLMHMNRAINRCFITLRTAGPCAHRYSLDTVHILQPFARLPHAHCDKSCTERGTIELHKN